MFNACIVGAFAFVAFSLFVRALVTWFTSTLFYINARLASVVTFHSRVAGADVLSETLHNANSLLFITIIILCGTCIGSVFAYSAIVLLLAEYSTLAPVRIDLINTGPAILTWRRGAIVDIRFTIHATPPLSACTVVINLSCLKLTGSSCAFLGAVFARVICTEIGHATTNAT